MKKVLLNDRAFLLISLVVTFTSLLLSISVSFVDGGRRTSTTVGTTAKPVVPPESDDDAWGAFNSTNQSFSHILIGAFNIRKFGLPKTNNDLVLKILVKIVIRYDLIAVTEITDRTESAIKKLMGEVNYESEHPYHYVVSSRVGRTNNKEQYALIYRPDVIQVKNHFVYNDSEKDPFAREPLIAQLLLKGRDQEVALVAIHVKPTDAVAEINALTDVHDWIHKKLKIKDVFILGDFNADCQYVPKKAWKTIGLRNADKFVWLIGDEMDTTVGKTDCAYDRIVISGPFLRNSVMVKSARVFKFDEVYGLNETTALQVSDHYPVEFSIRVSSASTNLLQESSSAVSPNYYYCIFGAIPAIWEFLFRSL